MNKLLKNRLLHFVSFLLKCGAFYMVWLKGRWTNGKREMLVNSCGCNLLFYVEYLYFL